MREFVKTFVKEHQILAEMYDFVYLFRKYGSIHKVKLLMEVKPYTMVSYFRLFNVYELSELVEKEKLNGCFVECGVWRGGCAAVMGSIADRIGSNRKIWLFDSFEGLPEPSKKDGQQAKVYAGGRNSGDLKSIGRAVASLEDVERLLFSKLKLNRNNLVIVKGWFQEVLPYHKQRIGPIAILRIDADWHHSTKVCLECLYDNVIEGGYVILDDYGYWEGCRKAVNEFIEERKLKVKLEKIDETGYYFRKS